VKAKTEQTEAMQTNQKTQERRRYEKPKQGREKLRGAL